VVDVCEVGGAVVVVGPVVGAGVVTGVVVTAVVAVEPGASVPVVDPLDVEGFVPDVAGFVGWVVAVVPVRPLVVGDTTTGALVVPETRPGVEPFVEPVAAALELDPVVDVPTRPAVAAATPAGGDDADDDDAALDATVPTAGAVALVVELAAADVAGFDVGEPTSERVPLS